MDFIKTYFKAEKSADAGALMLTAYISAERRGRSHLVEINQLVS